MPAEPLKRPTLSTLANLWGQSIPAVSNDLARMGLTIQKDGVDGCTRAKIKLLRQSAMGRSTEEGVDLNDLKAEKIIAETELIRINIARESGTLVSIDDLEPLLANLAVSTRAELLSMANKVTDEVEL